MDRIPDPESDWLVPLARTFSYFIAVDPNARTYRGYFYDRSSPPVAVGPWRRSEIDARVDCNLNYNEARPSSGHHVSTALRLRMNKAAADERARTRLREE